MAKVAVTSIGANGAGKSTTLRTVAGLIRPDSGPIKFKGQSVVGVKSHKVVERGMALCPEGRRVFSQMSVFENLDIGGYTRSPLPTAPTCLRSAPSRRPAPAPTSSRTTTSARPTSAASGEGRSSRLVIQQESDLHRIAPVHLKFDALGRFIYYRGVH